MAQLPYLKMESNEKLSYNSRNVLVAERTTMECIYENICSYSLASVRRHKKGVLAHMTF